MAPAIQQVQSGIDDVTLSDADVTHAHLGHLWYLSSAHQNNCGDGESDFECPICHSWQLAGNLANCARAVARRSC